ncbi:xanthine dehydrogenase accessory factor [Rhizobium leguminosarum]|uniref:Xanthine dehydrogenase accessory factor n=1 Tax=Rhizobium leguminosarum TaxID=384 RepID=A0AAE2SXV5_RHILE|nr:MULTISPECIES: XdhC family protein [Rhizobium]MBB4291790.1 xanthine dehydrogenase accessory factor [Rhizobium leguminosarum]MBB4298391.1 xanthine dehydrogenase accessory factor [Rhizobium leguminosarum]MBB4309529.1 xanthine dehydrogenase accessory factor [Rhizobium leguminosarum]MBB4418966.1 xanthine dehydrogenase accessory factor [Rhizobium leguminosarum]MBB4433703.1 xanthine dehydrogenase accessory factor [Rhizobium esperanzae]
MDVTHLARLNAARLSRVAVVLVTDLETGTHRLVAEGDGFDGAITAAIASVFRSGRSGIVEANGKLFFLNVYLPPPRIVIIGAVHISQLLAQFAALAGFDVRIIDPRTAFATPERFAGIDLRVDWPVDALKKGKLDVHTALVAVAHDPKIDDFPIAEAIRTGCFYVGALGSTKTHTARLERLKAEGFAGAELARINSPIGLNIGAESPAEIAVAILAQVIEALRSRDATSPKGDKR